MSGAAVARKGAGRETGRDTPALLERVKLILQFKVLTALLFVRKRLYALLNPRLEKEKPMVNIGGGIFLRPHWKVMDYVSPFYPFARRYIDYNVDLFEKPRFPFDDDSVAFFYSSHTLEHIPQECCPHILSEMYRCLRPGGAVRLTMPDYDLMREAVAAGNREYFKTQLALGLTMEQAVVQQIAIATPEDSDPASIRRNYETMAADEFADYYTSRASRELQREKAGYHINWFNARKLSAMLEEAGFREVYRSHAQGSRFPELRGEGGVLALGNILDSQRRLGIDTSHPDKSLFMEAVK